MLRSKHDDQTLICVLAVFKQFWPLTGHKKKTAFHFKRHIYSYGEVMVYYAILFNTLLVIKQAKFIS